MTNRWQDWKGRGDAESDTLAAELEQRYGWGRIEQLPRAVGKWEPGHPFQDPNDPTLSLEPEIVEFLQRPYRLPQWVDAAAVRAAQRRYQRDAQVGQIVLGTCSLPAVYLSPEISLTLMGSGQLMMHTLRRLKETQDFVDVAMTPEALLAAGDSWMWMRKIRLMHAVIRRIDAKRRARLAASGRAPMGQRAAVKAGPMAVRQRAQAQGRGGQDMPLDQLEQAYVLLTFSWLLPHGLDRLGYGLTRKECEQHIHLWALVGYLIGIDEQLLPGGPHLGAEQARPLYEQMCGEFLALGNPIGRVVAGAPEARLLMAALLTVLVEIQRQALPPTARRWVERFRLLDEVVKTLPRTVIRRLLGTPGAAILNIGRAPLLHALVHLVGLRLIDLQHWRDNIPPALLDEWKLR